MSALNPEHVPELRTYLTGLVLALVFTAIPFGVVYFHLLPVVATVAVIAAAAIAQVVVHLRFFLHIDFKSTPSENITTLLFTLFLICVMVGGSLWIMFDLYYRMGM
jgi:cytochrome o ubiquinol oxidase operon protein cyoD